MRDIDKIIRLLEEIRDRLPPNDGWYHSSTDNQMHPISPFLPKLTPGPRR